MKRFITVEEARQQILERLPRLSTERIFLSQALGRILAESVEAPTDSPRFDNSARDGYALRFDDLEGDRPTLSVIGTAAAGTISDLHVEPGTAARIMTGAVVPEGADTIVMQEYCEVDEDAGTVTVLEVPEKGRGAWVRKAGENMAAGEAVLEPGARLGAPEVGLLASFGRSVIEVSRRPRVAIVSTGDELVELDQEPQPGQIINSNAYMLEALVHQAGGEAVVLPPAADTEEAVRDTFEQALQSADIVVSSGGVSVGDFDITREVVDELTGGMNFWKIRMKPGKPLAFGTADTDGRDVPLIGLPGNPNSCFVCFHQFVRPALAVMQGVARDGVVPRRLDAILAGPVQTTPKRRVYLSGTLRGRVGDKPEFVPFDNQNSGNLRLFCGAEAFGVCEEGVARMEAGDEIAVELIEL
ncbi:molybdopterin molybdotransferase MoeA [Persicimonas caeni]|uniref:Molybdopterin molybdenumtransferase n=1 Tax=Persicimonas caeni TaxID=2292766 RepID=A0A4Y6PQB1_PERCE|nr:gephyrin-like molybdotransferase Glp [Persicimonas caeni]QDG49955.1 molybdopterin molybdotransferase MoeA [Persicimonas caeni]QED31176.1 molybdopterin molybdotransferase MoeA [Persicimonas caeni]